jgi:hypothetical protein
MADRELSLSGLAELYRVAVAKQGLRSGADRNLVWKWKTGRRTPTIESQQYLADALDVPRSVLADHDWPDWLWRAVAGPRHVLQPPWSAAGTLRVLHEVAGGAMDRRDFLVITGTALTGLANRWSASLTGPSDRIVSGAPRLTDDILDRLDGRLAELRHLDDAFGGRQLHRLADAEFRWLSSLADSAVRENSVELRLLGLIAEAARLCGWCHFDAKHHAAAQSYYVTALRASASAADPMAGAHVLACMSLQAMFTGHSHEAVSLIDTAEEQLRHSGTPRVKALLASRKARAYARSGATNACERALNMAEKHLDRARLGDSEPDWIYYFDDAELAAQAGACWIDLRQPASARPLIDDALGTMDSRYVRDRAIYHARSAEAYFHDDELDAACQELTTAAELAHQTDSVHTVDTIRRARLCLTRYNDDTRVHELDQRLAELVI